ncbi:unnamed protein product, partial [Polarella glacialis]
LIGCAGYAILLSIREERQRCVAGTLETTEHFITARNSVGTALLSYSLFAGAMGSWVTTVPATYASTAGLLGLTVYSLAAGAPLIVAAYAGALARSSDP